MTNQSSEIKKNTVRLYIARNSIFSCFIFYSLEENKKTYDDSAKDVLANIKNSLMGQIAMGACKLIDDREQIYLNLIEEDSSFVKAYQQYYRDFGSFKKESLRLRDKAKAHCDPSYLLSTTKSDKKVKFGYVEIYEKIFEVVLKHLFHIDAEILVNGQPCKISGAFPKFKSYDKYLKLSKDHANSGVMKLFTSEWSSPGRAGGQA